MSAVQHDAIRQTVRQRYTHIAENEGCGCAPSCCGGPDNDSAATSQSVGYSAADTTVVPDGANMGLGCGTPLAIADLKPGETVLDLGSGGGFDCFLAAREVGATGHVIGIDMTPAMITKARGNAEKGGYANVEFRLGEIEHLPVADGCVDVIISNCVINLSPHKAQVFADAFRVLKPGGRLAVSDVVAFADLPDDIRNDPTLLTGCMAGASSIADIGAMLGAGGFEQIRIRPKDESKSFIRDWAPDKPITDYVVSATIEAVKPGACTCCCSDTDTPTLRQASADDLDAIRSLLSRCQLPGEDLTEASLRHFSVLASGRRIVGVCGIERFGSDGLIRSLAVDPVLRGRKFGEQLVAACESAAQDIGIERLYLLTTTARDYLLRLGYADVARESAPDGVRTHPQFRGLCPASARCLVKRLQ
ncbi:arsenic resistance N-acetyltransferase ArsN2 [uncultured Propionivibrio sp.]|uniref:arsenic resistance N-acetyltransferase ArsN2 n=1 Tax=uncultured Propionivibrio sp. TaxID=426737 RepID=UPI0029BFAFF3|nr:arsenic resistance N-acetyltransferase ArsN2 [uncultured Propionivibrio sp.]